MKRREEKGSDIEESEEEEPVPKRARTIPQRTRDLMDILLEQEEEEEATEPFPIPAEQEEEREWVDSPFILDFGPEGELEEVFFFKKIFFIFSVTTAYPNY